MIGIVLVLAGPLAAVHADPVQSGPPAGAKVPGPFQALNINGPYAGKKHCLYCENGMRPAVMIFAREISPNLVGLLRGLDAAAAAASRPMGAYVIFCSDDPNLPGQLESLVKSAGLSRVIVATFHADGPAEYRIAADADVTALLYRRVTVVANHAFRRGELTPQAAQAILAELPRILTED
jgi:hypothetical protein